METPQRKKKTSKFASKQHQFINTLHNISTYFFDLFLFITNANTLFFTGGPHHLRPLKNIPSPPTFLRCIHNNLSRPTFQPEFGDLKNQDLGYELQ